jgi:DNA-binding NarL/FixJ family response regulator
LLKAGFNSLAFADNGLLCISAVCKDEHPDVVIIDESQCYLNGLDIIEKIRSSWPETNIIILTGIDSDLIVDLFPDTGLMYFMDKKSITADNLPQLLYTIVTKKISSTIVPKPNKVYSSLRRSFTGMLNSILI